MRTPSRTNYRMKNRDLEESVLTRADAPSHETSPNPALLAAEINTCWLKAKGAVLETAARCAEAATRLNSMERTELIEKLHFSQSTFTKLIKIGNAQHLNKQDTFPLLPTSYSILYEIATLDDIQFQFALKEGIINPSISREDIIRWKRSLSAAEGTPSDQLLGTIIATRNLQPEEKLSLLEKLTEVCARQPAAKFRPFETAASRAYSRIKPSVEEYIRRKARALVRTLKKKRGNKWSYSSDEVNIDDCSTPSEIKEILHFIGAEDDFAEIMKRATLLEEQALEKWMARYPESYAEQPNTLTDRSAPNCPGPEDHHSGMPYDNADNSISSVEDEILNSLAFEEE
jgi:hypothetical protein